jgi:hypothetical protein
MLLVDILGYLGLALNLVALLASTRNRLLLIQISSSLAFSLHFILLGAVAGALQVIVTIVRNILFLNSKKFQQPVFILYGILILSVVMAIVGWQGPVTLLVMASVLLGTVGRWQGNLELLLIFSFIATVFTLLFAIAVSSIPAIISSIIQLIITSVAVVRSEWKTHFLQDRFRDWHVS